MFGSILAGQAGPSVQGIAIARGAAYQIYNLIDRVSHLISKLVDIFVVSSSSFTPKTLTSRRTQGTIRLFRVIRSTDLYLTWTDWLLNMFLLKPKVGVFEFADVTYLGPCFYAEIRWPNGCIFQILLFLGGGNSELNFGAGLAQIQLWTTSPDRQLLFHSFFVRIFVKYFQNVFLLFFAF